MRRKIDQIVSINLIHMSFNIDEDNLKNQKDGIIELAIRYGITDDLKKNDGDVYLSKIKFNLILGPVEEKKDIEKVITESGISMEFEMTFLGKDDISELDNDLRKEILSIVEPYIREKTNYLFSSSKHGVPPIPYHFWDASGN